MARALVALTPSEGKRLIGKAVARMEAVCNALSNGTVVICPGTTNAYVAEEIIGNSIDKGRFTIGVITPKGACVSKSKARLREIVLSKGKRVDLSLKEAVDGLGPRDAFIKGANAVDVFGNAGVYLGSSTGGTMGLSIGPVLARGVKMIIPVSLEKLVPYPIMDIAPRLGSQKLNAAMGLPFGMMPLPGEIVTEVEAINMLFGCECIPVGGGGVNGGEGSHCYLMEGDEDSVKAAWESVCRIKGEAVTQVEIEECTLCKFNCQEKWKDVA
ncbi:MAG: hypothetical protein LUP94_01450 [Candidatus Methanomethylicus sp.]|nr:hypothetical protein [Candidatus Methanomethylicus sp.]